MICADRRNRAALRNLLAFVMSDGPAAVKILSTVALLDDLSDLRLGRGHVGAVVELLDEATASVEFADEEGRPYSVAPCPLSVLLPLRTAPLAA